MAGEKTKEEEEEKRERKLKIDERRASLCV